MKLKFVEASNGLNWGKFAVGRLEDHEWAYETEIHDAVGPLIRQLGWTREHVWVLDLQTGEGAWFRPGGFAEADLNDKHQLWVCLLFEPFLTWLYGQDLTDLDALPSVVQLPDAPAGIYGHRRQGPQVRDALLKLLETRWWHSCETGPGGCHAVSEAALAEAIEALGIPMEVYP